VTMPEMNSSVFESIFDPEMVRPMTDALQPSLVDLLALQLIVKQLHWNVTGPGFRPIHLHLDEIYEVVTEAIDSIAERLSAIAISPSGQAGDIISGSDLAPVAPGFLLDSEVLKFAHGRLGTVCRNLRSRMETIEDVDAVTADLFHAILLGLEKHLWMLRVQLTD
jgi:starvation-inducible DNA-binding protein